MPIHLPPVSRRDFLRGTLAAGAGLLLPQWLQAREAEADPNLWVLSADAHLWEFRDKVHSGTRPAETFAVARRGILALDPPPAAMIIAGDCVYIEGNPGDYAVLGEEIAPIRKAGIPVHLVLGNHDNREHFYAAFPEAKPAGRPPVPDKHVAVVETPHANWFLLDSLKRTNYTPGELGQPQRRWLAAELDARPDKPALVVAHHYPNRTERGEPLPSGLADTQELFAILLPRKQVKAYIFGHSHCWSVGRHEGIHLVNVPATAWLFDQSQPRGWVEAQLAAGGATLRLHALDPNHPKNGETVKLAWRS